MIALVTLLLFIGAADALQVRAESTTSHAALTANGKADFMRRVYEAQVKRAMQRRKSFADLPDDQLSAVERGHRMRRAAAEQCRLLLDAAKSDLRRQKEEKDERALGVSRIGTFSAYRSVARDRAAWKAAFAKHFAATRQARAQLKGGEYGDEAVEMMVRIMRSFKAPPGFSRHTAGVAVDFTTTEGRIVLGANSSQAARWRKSWLHKWLIKNAKKFKFKPLATEPWHWEYTG